MAAADGRILEALRGEVVVSGETRVVGPAERAVLENAKAAKRQQVLSGGREPTFETYLTGQLQVLAAAHDRTQYLLLELLGRAPEILEVGGEDGVQ